MFIGLPRLHLFNQFLFSSPSTPFLTYAPHNPHPQLISDEQRDILAAYNAQVSDEEVCLQPLPFTRNDHTGTENDSSYHSPH
jgi:hypothetical protein